MNSFDCGTGATHSFISSFYLEHSPTVGATCDSAAAEVKFEQLSMDTQFQCFGAADAMQWGTLTIVVRRYYSPQSPQIMQINFSTHQVIIGDYSFVAHSTRLRGRVLILALNILFFISGRKAIRELRKGSEGCVA